MNEFNPENFKLREGEYLPLVGIDYPVDDPYKGLVHFRKVRDLKFDESYPFLDDSFAYRIQWCFVNCFVAFGVLFLANKIKFGIKYKGRDVLKRYKKEFSDGLVCVSNHCFPWDAAAICQATRHTFWIPMLSEHFNSRNGWLLRHFGGIPVPDDFGGLRKFNQAFDTIHERKEWILIFPEARNWNFYKPLKPFRKGAFSMAYRYNCPILPVNISYRERKGIYKLFADPKVPLLTLTLGEPIFPDSSKPRKTEVDRLLRESHKRICEMGGIIQNPWPAYWDEEEGGHI